LKKLLSVLLVLVMVLGMFPASTMATESAQDYELKVLDFEGDYWNALIDDSQHSGKLLYGESGMGFATKDEAYKWTDETTKLSHVLPYNYDTYCYMGGGHAISHYNTANYESFGDYTAQLTVYNRAATDELSTVGGGNNGSDNFAVHYGYMDNSGYNQTGELPALIFADGEARVIDHMYVTTTSYAYNIYMNGCDYPEAPPIGESDWIKVVATGYNNETTTGTLYFDLVNGPDEITSEWTKWDLSALSEVTKVEFNLDGSSVNDYGLAQPAYFAYDDVAVRFPVEVSACEHPESSKTTEYVQVEGTETHTATVKCECGEAISQTTKDCTDEDANGQCDLCNGIVAPKTVEITDVSLNKQTLELMVGETETLVATVLPEDATDKTVTWKSSKTSVAKVDSNGKITAVKAGTATITATAGGKIAICIVTVSEPVIYEGTNWPHKNYYVESITMTGATINYIQGNRIYLDQSTKTTAQLSFTANTNRSGIKFDWTAGSTTATNKDSFSARLSGGEMTLKLRAYKTSGASSSQFDETKTFYFYLAEDNNVPTLAEGYSTTSEAQVALGSEYTLDLSRVFTDEDGDSLSYTVSVDGGAATKASANYSYLCSDAGLHTLEFTANDGKTNESKRPTYTVSLTVKNSDITYDVNVICPDGVTPEFYAVNKIDNGKVVKGDELVFENGIVKVPENISVITWVCDSATSGTAAVGVNAELNLKQVTFYTETQFGTADTAGEIKVTDSNGVTTTVGANQKALLATGDGYSYIATPSGNFSDFWNAVTLTEQTVSGEATVVLSYTLKSKKTITVPKEAQVDVYYQTKNYAGEHVTPVHIAEDVQNNTKTYYFSCSKTQGSTKAYVYRATYPDKITKAGFMNDIADVTLTWAADEKTPDYRNNSDAPNYSNTDGAQQRRGGDYVFMTVNSTGHLSLNNGQTKDIGAFRIWNIINTDTENVVIEPDYTFKVVAGDDIVDITDLNSPFGNNWQRISSIGNGTAFVEVSYDAIQVVSGYEKGGWGGAYGHMSGYTYNAIDPYATGLFVVQTDGNTASDVVFNIASDRSQLEREWDAEVDTYYITEDNGVLTLSPAAESGIQSVAVSNDKGANWTILEATDGKYNATVVPGNNIIRVINGEGKTAYQVVRVLKLDIVVENQSSPEKGTEFASGDTVRVYIRGLIAPLGKLGGIYNPGSVQATFTDSNENKHKVTVAATSMTGGYTFNGSTCYIDNIVIPESGKLILSGNAMPLMGYNLSNLLHRSITMNGVNSGTGIIEQSSASVLPVLILCAHTETIATYVKVDGAEKHITTVTCECGEQISQTTDDCVDSDENEECDLCKGSLIKPVYQVNVYVPKNTVGADELKFYATTGFDENNRDIFNPDETLTYATDSDTDYDIYKLTLTAGTYSFRAEGLGGGAFAIPAEKPSGGYEEQDNTSVYLRKVEAYILNTIYDNKATSADFSVEMSNDLGSITMGSAYTNTDGYACYPALVYANGNALLYYTEFTPSEEYAATNSVDSITHKNYAIERGTATDSIKMTLPFINEFVINAPAGADVALFNQIKNFNTVRIDAVTTRPQNDGTVDYVFNIARNSNMSYRASMEGKRTQSGFFTDITNDANRVVIDFGTDSPKEQDISGEFNGESSTLLNINERNKLNLTVGEQHKVRAYRAAWQIINTTTANIMIEPDFHYTVLSGEDVIGVETVSGGNAKDNWAWITAKKEGVAIVEVSYDAINVASGKIEGRNRDFYGASDPNRTGVFVVTVGSQYGDIGGINLDTEYNEVYFVGEQGNLTIAPKGDNISVSVASVWEGRMSGWTQVTGENGTFNVPIKSGNNILKITLNGTTDYRVVRGSKVTPVITNKTNAERTETVYPGDEIEIGFKGIYMPMPKFSGIYNPGFPSTMGISYKSGEESVSSPSTQYKLIELKIPFTVPSDAAGSVVLNNGRVYGTSLGSNWGEHRTLTDLGVPANFNASGIVLEEITLPDLTIRVARLSDDAAKQEAKDNINAAFASYDENKYSSQNWTEIVRIKNEALASIDSAETLSAITEIKNTALTAMANIEKKDSGNGGNSGNVGNTGINKTHTTSYYSTTGLDFGLSSDKIEGYVTISFEDYGKRLKDADFETPLGVLIKPTKVPFKKGDNIARVTIRLLDALKIQYTYDGNIENGFYLSKLKNFKLSDGTVVKEFGEFDSGAGSGWMITCNNWFVNRGTDGFKVEDGDLIKWQNTCQLGADIGCDWSKQSAKITGFKFERNYGTLSPKFGDSTKDYVYTVSSSVKSISMEATLENYWANLTCTSNGKTYKPMESIPVENGTVIEFRSSFAEYAGDVPTDEDYRTITIQVKGESTETPGGNAGVKDTAKKETTTTIKPEVTTNSSGEANVKINSKDVTNALTQAEKDNADVLEIAPEVKGDASKVEVSLPAESLNKIAESGLGLNVNTPVADIKLPEKAISALATQDGKLNVTASSDKDGKISIDVSVGGKTAEKIDGGVKVGLSDADNDKVMVIVNEDGSETIVTKHIAENGEHQAILPGSATIKMIDNHKEFTDTNGHWGEESINFVAGRELYQGVGDGRFDTEGTMTRAMLVTVLYRLEGESETDYEHSFNDVADDQWYADSVAWANANNIVKGVAEDSFDPNAFVTREQVATILYRYAQYLDMSTHHKGELTQFDDHHEVSDWAKDAKSWAVGAGIITGKPGNILDAGGDATRTEVAVILQRIIELMVK